MTGQDWVVVIPVLLLLTPLVFELFDRFGPRKVRVEVVRQRPWGLSVPLGGDD